jgi:hypothetical protein
MKRHIGIIIFVSLFITAISIIAIFVARGFTFTGSELKESGIINITSTPEGAEIIINGKKKETTPQKIELVAGKYEIILSKDGYVTWKKEIEVEAAIVADISAKLFPTKLSLEQDTFTYIDKAFYSQDGTFAIYIVSENTNRGIWISKLEKSIFELSSPQPTKIAEITELPEKCIQEKKYTMNISTDNTKAIIRCPLESFNQFMLINLNSQNQSLINLNERIGFNPDQAYFSFDANNVFVTDSQLIANLNLENDSLHLLSRKKEEFSPQITAFNKEFLLLEYSYDLEQKSLFRISSDFNKTLIDLPSDVNSHTITKISSSAFSEKYILISDSENTYIIDISSQESTINLTQSGVDVLSWSPNGKSILFVENDSLKTVLIKEIPNENLSIDTSVVFDQYTQSTYKISWTSNSQHLIYNKLDNNKLYVIDKDGQNKRLLFEGEIAFQDTFKLSSNETYLVLLLNDDNEFSNLYSLKLTI